MHSVSGDSLKLFYSAILISVLFLSSCSLGGGGSRDLEYLCGDLTVGTAVYSVRIDDSSVSLCGGDSGYEFRYFDGMLYFGDFSVPLVGCDNSVFRLYSLFSEVVSSRTFEGTYNGIEFHCDVSEESGLPSRLVWGSVTLDVSEIKTE